jgi:hypothetical protein
MPLADHITGFCFDHADIDLATIVTASIAHCMRLISGDDHQLAYVRQG